MISAGICKLKLHYMVNIDWFQRFVSDMNTEMEWLALSDKTCLFTHGHSHDNVFIVKHAAKPSAFIWNERLLNSTPLNQAHSSVIFQYLRVGLSNIIHAIHTYWTVYCAVMRSWYWPALLRNKLLEYTYQVHGDVIIQYLKDPVTHFFWFYIVNMMLKLWFINFVSSKKHYL
jgi:hypothetical protein